MGVFDPGRRFSLAPVLICVSSLLCPSVGLCGDARANDPLARLHGFLQAKTFKASFSQTVYDARHSVIDDSLGTVALRRPGQFRWEYVEPVRQIIVSDGMNLVIYDPDLRQASVQPLVEALGEAPISLLLEQRVIADRFEVQRGVSRDGLDWVLLVPEVQDTEFTRIELGLDADSLMKIKMLDHFEQTTLITFLQSELNPEVSVDTFRLYLPDTVDIVGEYLLPVIPPQP